VIASDTNLRTPQAEPAWPVYPGLEQLVRTTGGSFTQGGLTYYMAFTQQFSPPLGLRDREPCYVYEPNRFLLPAAIFDCRLVGSIQGLPLYATTCCRAGSSSSSPG